MKVAVAVSVSGCIAQMASLTTPNKLEYCLRHGYSLFLENREYKDAVRSVRAVIAPLLERFDFVWALDADAVITNLAQPVHELQCLGPAATACEEGIVPWNRLNCGSVVWRAGEKSQRLLELLDASRHEWEGLPCQWQTWMACIGGDLVTAAPLRAFNSCEWTHPGGDEGEPGTHWRPGDFVYHPCGVFPYVEKIARIATKLATLSEGSKC